MEIFKALKENCPNIHHALINLGHLSVYQENYIAAINFYNKALEKFDGNCNLEIELYLSKAYFKMHDYENCKKILQKLLVRYPQDLRLKYNLGLCLMQQANQTFNKNSRKVSET